MEDNRTLVKIAFFGGLLALLFFGGKKVKQVFDKSRVKTIIREFEGESLTAYPDANGHSIGVGHFIILPAEADLLTRTITHEESDALLDADLDKALAAVDRYVKVDLTNNQKAALSSLIFNIGVSAFANSTLLKKLNAGDYSGAQEQFAVWRRSSGAVNPALVARRTQEAALFVSPDVRRA